MSVRGDPPPPAAVLVVTWCYAQRTSGSGASLALGSGHRGLTGWLRSAPVSATALRPACPALHLDAQGFSPCLLERLTGPQNLFP